VQNQVAKSAVIAFVPSNLDGSTGSGVGSTSSCSGSRGSRGIGGADVSLPAVDSADTIGGAQITVAKSQDDEKGGQEESGSPLSKYIVINFRSVSQRS
jgi:hypothetical protein